MTDAQELHRSIIVADAHNDLLMCVTARTPERWVPYFAENWLPQLRAGGVNIQVLPIYVSDRVSQDTAIRQTLQALEAAHRIAAALPTEVALCTNDVEIEAAVASGRIALVLAMEGLSGIGHDIPLLGILHRLGVRVASLTHFSANVLADGSSEDEQRGGLSSSGVAAVEEMERLGIVVDVSHLSHRGVDDVLKLVTRPVMATHSGARAMRDHHRNLTDEHLDGIAATGGVIGLNCFGPFIHEKEQTLARLADHLEYLVQRVGSEHVGLGPDFMQELYDDLTPRARESRIVAGVDTQQFIPGLEGPSGLPLVTEELVRRGWPETDIRAVLGESIRTFLSHNLP